MLITLDGRNFAAVDLNGGHSGDIASLQFPAVSFNDPVCLHLEYLLEGDVVMDINIKHKQFSDFKQRICTLSYSDGWQFSDIQLPSGSYSLYFDAVLGYLEGIKIYIGKTVLLDRNCSLIQFSGWYLKITNLCQLYQLNRV